MLLWFSADPDSAHRPAIQLGLDLVVAVVVAAVAVVVVVVEKEYMGTSKRYNTIFGIKIKQIKNKVLINYGMLR